MILSARFTKNPQGGKLIICDDCELPVGGPHIRLYGMAHYGEKPYTLRMHVNCVTRTIDTSGEPKVEAALAKAAQAGANLLRADLCGAIWNKKTTWPLGFQPPEGEG